MPRRKKNIAWIIILVVTLAAGSAVIAGLGFSSSETYLVKKGSFEQAINVKGEIQGKDAVVINLPDELRLRDLRIYSLKLKDIVQEGTAVKKGDWVATLDAATINQQIQNNNEDLVKRRAELNDAKIDSTIELTQLREELEEFKYDLQYKELELEQSKYESPAYQRKMKMEYDKTVRQMEKKRRDYELKRLELKIKTQRIARRYEEFAERDELLKKAMVACRVTAPKDGMVMYAKLWGGRKIRVGDDISFFNPVIATLPDMSVLVSETYVKEIDITKIHKGDPVEITIDALPGKTYSGSISKIANMGQELPGFDTKVFRVLIDLEESNTEIKPAMTTDNRILLNNLAEVVKIPREAIYADSGKTFVYLRHAGKTWKKEIEPGLENDEEIVIDSGLSENDEIFIAEPEDAAEIAFLRN
ncbi:MAG TPA: HlyD family efflux transporter periplasmic adaptor subunit [Tangfeifania sp.]|nr:HlyD family efflux transporter periplasmic adaptor subunit [Tangfeifania sp.]